MIFSDRFTKKQLILFFLLFILGFIVFGVSIFLREIRTIPEWSGQIYDLQTVNSLDASLAHPYNYKTDKAANFVLASAHGILCIICFLIPGIMALKNGKGLLKVFLNFIFYCECWTFTFGTYRILKTIGGRLRPYMYFPEPSLKDIAEGDFISSWPSGHTSAAFIAVGYIFCWLLNSNLNSTVKKGIMIAVFIIASVTGCLRILSGNHFLTDVVTGAATGFSISVIIYMINQKNIKTV